MIVRRTERLDQNRVLADAIRTIKSFCSKGTAHCILRFNSAPTVGPRDGDVRCERGSILGNIC